jgi:hypothetical protein
MLDDRHYEGELVPLCPTGEDAVPRRGGSLLSLSPTSRRRVPSVDPWSDTVEDEARVIQDLEAVMALLAAPAAEASTVVLDDEFSFDDDFAEALSQDLEMCMFEAAIPAQAPEPSIEEPSIEEPSQSQRLEAMRQDVSDIRARLRRLSSGPERRQAGTAAEDAMALIAEFRSRLRLAAEGERQVS